MITRNHTDYEEIRRRLFNMNHEIRNIIPISPQIDFETAGYIQVKEGYLNGRSIDRLIVILRGSGCEWAGKENGGCIMCGHYAGSSRGVAIPHASLKKQFDKSIKTLDTGKYPMLCLYNGGSFLNENEIPADVRNYMFKRIQSLGYIERLIIESRPEYITDDIFAELEESMPGVEVEIGVGLESSNDHIRNLILNKGVGIDEYKELGKKFRSRRTRFLAYVLVKPPFLTESEAITDAILTINFASRIGVEAIYLEPICIQDFTLLSRLREAGLYRPPWIWSIFEIIKQTIHLGIEIRIGGFDFYPIPREFTSNCQNCDAEMIQTIKAFNKLQDPDLIRHVNCPGNCNLEWEKERMKREPDDFSARVASALDTLESLYN